MKILVKGNSNEFLKMLTEAITSPLPKMLLL